MNREQASGAAGPRLRFGPDRRLRKRSEFKRVYENGRRVRGRLVTLFHAPRLRRDEAAQAPVAPPWRLGITATRKTGCAVERNRQRRRLKEFFRIHQFEIPDGWDYVINTTPALNTATPAELERDLAKVLAPVGFRRGEPARPAQTNSPDAGS